MNRIRIKFKWSDHVIEANDGTFKGYTEPMVDLSAYDFEGLNIGELHLKNLLQIITQRKFMTHNMSILLLNDYE